MTYKEIQINEILILNNNIYQVKLKPWSNGEKRGHRPHLIKLNQKELFKILVSRNRKEGLKE